MAEFTHSIKAYLYDNVLTDNPNDLIARVSSERSLSIKDICQSAVARGGADISAAAMEHAVNLWLKEMGYRLCDVFSANEQRLARVQYATMFAVIFITNYELIITATNIQNCF